MRDISYYFQSENFGEQGKTFTFPPWMGGGNFMDIIAWEPSYA